MDNKINVMLFGGFDKKSKNRAEIVYCDRCEDCSLYKKGKCLSVSAPFSSHCKYGKVSKIQGFTQRAMKRYEFDARYKNDEKYGALKHPSDWRIAVMGDTVALNLTFAICDKKGWNDWKHEWEELEEYKTRECRMFGISTISYIPISDFSTKVIHNILTYIPMSIFGHNEISDYRKKIVPNILFEMSKILPDTYNKLIQEYPAFAEIVPNFIGKRAYVNSLADGVVLNDDRGKFVKKGEYLESDCWKSAFLPFGSNQATVRILITDKMVCKITDNSQVDENTVFEN